jgi:pilus assembly protein CpaB
MRIIIISAVALIVAVSTGYYLLQEMRPAPQLAITAEAEGPRSTEVLVPAVQLTAGTILRAEHLTTIGLDESAITPEMVVADEAGRTLLIGSVARQPLPRGVPIARSATVHPGERGFLAAVLPQGKRAISIPISETAGISGLVQPGDRVDIILTYSISGGDIDAERDVKASETVMTNLRVLALDQRLGAQDQVLEATGNVAPVPVARTATLEVTPRQAEMMTLATTLGTLSMVLNSVRDGGDPEVAEGAEGEEPTPASPLEQALAAHVADGPRQMTLDSDVTSLLQRQSTSGAAEEPAPVVPGADALRLTRIQVVRGIERSQVEFGGDMPPATGSGSEPSAEPAPQPVTE